MFAVAFVTTIPLLGLRTNGTQLPPWRNRFVLKSSRTSPVAPSPPFSATNFLPGKGTDRSTESTHPLRNVHHCRSTMCAGKHQRRLMVRRGGNLGVDEVAVGVPRQDLPCCICLPVSQRSRSNSAGYSSMVSADFLKFGYCETF